MTVLRQLRSLPFRTIAHFSAAAKGTQRKRTLALSRRQYAKQWPVAWLGYRFALFYAEALEAEC